MDNEPNPIDVHVGRRVRRRRRELGLSQREMADSLAVTFQQVQKYERGANRVSASKLYGIAQALKTPVGYFFEGLPDLPTPKEDSNARANSDVIENLLAQPDGPQLLDAFLRIRRRSVRTGLANLATEIAALGLSDDDDVPINARVLS